jgi:hypothetical protein
MLASRKMPPQTEETLLTEEVLNLNQRRGCVMGSRLAALFGDRYDGAQRDAEHAGRGL